MNKRQTSIIVRSTRAVFILSLLGAAAAADEIKTVHWPTNCSGMPSRIEQPTNYCVIPTNLGGWCVTNPADGSLSDEHGNYIIKPWKVQLSAGLSSELVTNWTTTSIEYPQRPEPKSGLGYITLEYYATGYHQTGIILSNTVATIEWNDRKIPVVVESVTVGQIRRTEWK